MHKKNESTSDSPDKFASQQPISASERKKTPLAQPKSDPRIDQESGQYIF